LTEFVGKEKAHDYRDAVYVCASAGAEFIAEYEIQLLLDK
jgi:hypothetical protein